MNRLELIAFLLALDKIEDLDSMKTVIKEVLSEARKNEPENREKER